REKNDLGGDAERPQHSNESAVEPHRVPVQRGKAIEQRMARLNETRSNKHCDKCRAAQRGRTRRALCIMLWCTDGQWFQFPGRKSNQNACRRHEPDQVAGGNDIGRQASCKVAENESKRAPQSHRSISSSPRRKALECVSFR